MKCLNLNLINEQRFWSFFNDEAEKYGLCFNYFPVTENKDEGYSLQIYDLLNADGKKIYETSFFFDKEIKRGGGIGLFGLYSSAFKDVSFIASVISSIANLDKKVIKGDKVLIERLEYLTGFLQGQLYKYGAYNKDPTVFKYVLEQYASLTYSFQSKSKRVNVTVIPYEEQHTVNVCLTTEGEPHFECNASAENIGNSFCREFRKALRQGEIAKKSPLRKLFELANSYYCQGISDRLLDILDKNNIEIMDILGIERKGDLMAVLQLPDEEAKKVVYIPNDEKSFVSSFRKVFGNIH
jgi:hypothetical protein